MVTRSILLHQTASANTATMPAVHNYRSKDRSTHIVSTDLTGEDIHPVFHSRALRFAYFHIYLTLDELSGQTFADPSILYNRMLPSLRFATRMIKLATLSLMRIAFALIVSVPTAGARQNQAPGDCWSYRPDEVWMFENSIMNLITGQYRVLILSDDNAS
jgi:hypothetical protein